MEKSSLSKEEEKLTAQPSDPSAKEPMDQDEANEPSESGFPVGNEMDFGTSMERTESPPRLTAAARPVESRG